MQPGVTRVSTSKSEVVVRPPCVQHADVFRRYIRFKSARISGSAIVRRRGVDLLTCYGEGVGTPWCNMLQQVETSPTVTDRSPCSPTPDEEVEGDSMATINDLILKAMMDFNKCPV